MSSCSIHLGNYIMVVQPPTPRKPDPGSAIAQMAIQQAAAKQSISPMKKKGAKQAPIEPKPVSMKTITQVGHDMGALDFELAWLRFIREAEDNYQQRLCRNDTSKPMSIFDMNIDLFETYLLKASGRALSSTQHLNLSLTSAMVSHMKIFDTQHPEAPSEFEQDLENEMELEKRRHQREARQRKRRRITASFNIEEEEQKQEDPPAHIQQPNQHHDSKPPVVVRPPHPDGVAVKKMLDSLNERDDVECGYSEGEGAGKLQEEFDVNDRSQTIQIEHPLLQALPPSAAIENQSTYLGDQQQQSMQIQDQSVHLEGGAQEQQPENIQRPDQNMAAAPSTNEALILPQKQQQIQSQTLKQQLRDFRASQLQPDSIIQTDEGGAHPALAGQEGGKIMIGDQSIDENFGDILGNEPHVQAYNTDEEDDHLDRLHEEDYGNPFRRKSVSFVKEQSIVSQGSLPMTLTIEGTAYMHAPMVSPFASGPEQSLFIASGGLPPVQLTSSLEIPQKTKEDFAYMQSPSMPEVNGQEEELNPLSGGAPEETKEVIIDRLVEVGKPHRTEAKKVLQSEPPIIAAPPAHPVEQPLMHKVSKDVTPQAKNTEIARISEEPEHRPTTAQGALLAPAIIMEARPVTANYYYQQLNHSPHKEVKEVVIQTTFDLKDEVPEAPVRDESEVILRFEVAVGQTPPDNRSLVEQQQSTRHAVDEAVGGQTPINRSLEEAAQQLLLGGTKMLAIGVGSERAIEASSSERHAAETSLQRASDEQHSRTHNASQEDRQQSKQRLEVTLTAEPDKPIMVEVRGGEKQFLISALTKHIYDILSQPHRLQLPSFKVANGESEVEAPYRHEEEPYHDQQEIQDLEEEDFDQVKQIKIGKNINLKLKSLKKNLKPGTRNSLGQQPSFEQQAITIENLDMSSKVLDTSQNQHSQVQLQQQETSVILKDGQAANSNWPTPVLGKSSRSSSGIALSPLTASVLAGEEGKRGQALKAPPNNLAPQQRRTERFNDVRYDQISKGTTEEAYADARIREEVRLTQIFDSDPAQSLIGVHPLQNKRDTQNASNRRDTGSLLPTPTAPSEVRKRDTKASLHQEQVMSDEVIGVPPLRSRPETANFHNNQENVPQLRPSQTELPPINMKSSQLSNRLLEQSLQQQNQHPRTPKYPGGVVAGGVIVGAYDEEIIYTEKQASRGLRRAQTPEELLPGQIHQSIIEDHGEINGDFINSTTPVEIEQFSLPPLQPTIPMPHPNGYFSSEAGGDYMILNRQDSQNYILMTNSAGNSLAVAPDNNGAEIAEDLMLHQVNYYDPYQGQPQMVDGGQYYQYSPNGYPDQDLSSTSPDEYILAEGYLLHFKDGERVPVKRGVEVGVVDRQVYDLSRHQPNIQQTGAAAGVNGSSTNVNRFGQTRQGTNQGQERSGYPPHHPGSKKAHKLPIVNAKKRVLGQLTNQGNTSIYGLNGGPVYRTLPYTPARSLSPLRRKNYVHYTANLGGADLTAVNQQSTILNPGTYHDVAYYSQSPLPNRVRHSPYLSDDEFKILHDFYDIQCEPTGLHRGGVPLMRVKRIKRPRQQNPYQRTYNIFNFTEEMTNNNGGAAAASTAQASTNMTSIGGGVGNSGSGVHKALSSLQIFYPQYQPASTFKQELLLSRTLATPSKWFDRFYQSTRNLNQTIQNLHKQHSRKLRSYSVSNLSSGGEAVATGGVHGLHAVRSSSRELNSHQTPLFTKSPLRDIQEVGSSQTVDTGVFRDNAHMASHPDMNTTQSSNKHIKKTSASVKGNANGAAVFMPPLHPLHKIYAANNSHDQAQVILHAAAERGAPKKNKQQLPPRPAGSTAISGNIFKQQSAAGTTNATSQMSEKKTSSGAAPVIIPPPLLSANSTQDGGRGANISINSISAAT